MSVWEVLALFIGGAFAGAFIVLSALGRQMRKAKEARDR